MPRRRYQSDEDRLKTRPHVRIHTTIRNHPSYGECFDDPRIFGMWVHLLVVARGAYAGQTDDTVTLSLGDLCWITGSRRPDIALMWLQRLADIMGYTVVKSGRRWDVHIRNFERKQGLRSARRGISARNIPHSAASESESETNIRVGRGVGGVERGQEGQERVEKDASYRWPQEIPPLPKEEFLKVVRFAKKRGFRGDIRPALEQAIRRVGLNSRSQSWQELMDGMTFEQLQAELEVRMPNAASRLERGGPA